ncbi:MAG: hypothetical protein Q7S26_00840 [bacterium]|nr:hypothetical protein [bacterium]
MKPTTIVGAVVVVLVAGGAWWYFGNTYQTQLAAPADVNTTTQAPVDTPQTQPQEQPSTNVTYTDSGFSPSTVTIAQGGMVTFANQSGGQMWVASGLHPTHTGYSGTSRTQHCPDTAETSFDQCTAVPAGQSYSFTFQKTGTWPYHNHFNSGDFGTIVVQ